jgi:cytidylate kinase
MPNSGSTAAHLADESPLHGFQGNRLPGVAPAIPLAPSIAVSREVGARGGEIARRLAVRLRWQAYDREMLEYAVEDQSAIDAVLTDSPPDAASWIESRLHFLQQHNVLSDRKFERVARLILALAAKGEAIFVGCGAGFLLPRESTLHVRMIAPLADRIAYMSQRLRLSREEAAEQVRQRSAQRDKFQAACFHIPSDGMIYDMVLNSSALGEGLCSDLVVEALRCKHHASSSDSEISLALR